MKTGPLDAKGASTSTLPKQNTPIPYFDKNIDLYLITIQKDLDIQSNFSFWSNSAQPKVKYQGGNK